jgi:hypothetical protein
MKSIKGIIALTAMIISSQTVRASQSDFAHFNNYTIDNISGLAWLDLSQTVELTYGLDLSATYDAVLTAANNNNSSLFGWHYATVSDFENLLTDYTDVPNALGVTMPYSKYTGLVDSLGATLSTLDSDPPAWGSSDGLLLSTSNDFLNIGSISTARHIYEGFGWWSPADIGSIRTESYNESNSAVSSFLVRDANTLPRPPLNTPLPPAIVMFASGLIGLGVLRRK